MSLVFNFKRLVNDGIFYRRKRMPKKLNDEQNGVTDIQAIKRILGKIDGGSVV